MLAFKKHKKIIISIVVLGLFLIWTITPLFLVVLQSIKPRLVMFADPPVFLFKPSAESFVKIFSKQNILNNIWNSLIVGFSATLVCLILGSTGAYALARLRIPLKNVWGLFVLIIRMVPASSLMVPIYTLFRMIGLQNSTLAVVIAHVSLNLPFAIWLLRSFFEDVPYELEQAAQIDGSSRIRSFTSIALPLASGGLVAVAILTMLSSWNEFMFALILVGRANRTLPVAISSFTGVVSIDWGASSAAAVLAIIPIFIASTFIHKYLVRGMTLGAIKG